jgi:hypothetical protein
MEDNEEKFEISMRIMSKEVLAFTMLSNSKRKNWVSLAVITLVIIVVLVDYALPGITTALGYIG